MTDDNKATGGSDDDPKGGIYISSSGVEGDWVELSKDLLSFGFGAIGLGSQDDNDPATSPGETGHVSGPILSPEDPVPIPVAGGAPNLGRTSRDPVDPEHPDPPAPQNTDSLSRAGVVRKTDADGNLVEAVDVLNDPSATPSQKLAAVKSNLPEGYKSLPGPPGTATIEWTGSDGHTNVLRIYPDGSYSALSGRNNENEIHWTPDGKNVESTHTGTVTHTYGSVDAQGHWHNDGSWSYSDTDPQASRHGSINETSDGKGNASTVYGDGTRAYCFDHAVLVNIDRQGNITITRDISSTNPNGRVFSVDDVNGKNATISSKPDGTVIVDYGGGKSTVVARDNTRTDSDTKTGDYRIEHPNGSYEEGNTQTHTWVKVHTDSKGDQVIERSNGTKDVVSSDHMSVQHFDNNGHLTGTTQGPTTVATDGAIKQSHMLDGVHAEITTTDPTGAQHTGYASMEPRTKLLTGDPATDDRDPHALVKIDAKESAVKLTALNPSPTPPKIADAVAEVFKADPGLIDKVAQARSVDASHAVANPDGSHTATHPDGRTVTTHPDGSTTVANPDGSLRNFDANGRLTGGTVMGAPAPSPSPASGPAEVKIGIQALSDMERDATTRDWQISEARTTPTTVTVHSSASVIAAAESLNVHDVAAIMSAQQDSSSHPDKTELNAHAIEMHPANVTDATKPDSHHTPLFERHVDNMTAWGDSQFRQGTGESLHTATTTYRQAADALGPRPQQVTRGAIPQPASPKTPDTHLAPAEVNVADHLGHVAMNPQPLPPKALDLHLTKSDATIHTDKAALNPQPLPPKVFDAHVVETEQHAVSHYPAGLGHTDAGAHDQHNVHLTVSSHEAGSIAHDFGPHDASHHHGG